MSEDTTMRPALAVWPVDLEGVVSPERIGRCASLRVGIHS